MPALIIQITKSRFQTVIDQVLNTASMRELKNWQDAIRQGARLGDLLQAGASGIRATPAELEHTLTDIYNRTGQGWWGKDVEEIATEGIAQTIQRMLYDRDDQPRVVQKRVDSYWLSPGFVTYYSNLIVESDYQITLLAVTPPQPSQTNLYRLYQQNVANKPQRDRLIVPANLTRDEDIWVVTSVEDAAIYGVDSDDNPVKMARTVPLLSPFQQVAVIRTRCEDFENVFIQDMAAS